MIKGIRLNQKRMPLHKVTVKTDYVSGEVVVAVTDKFPMPGIDLLLCNDLVLGKPTDNVILANEPTTTSEDTVVSYHACVVTRAQAAKVELDEDKDIQLADTFMSDPDKFLDKQSEFDLTKATHSKAVIAEVNISLSQQQLIKQQTNDAKLEKSITEALSPSEAAKVACCTYYDSGVLMRKWRHCETPAKEEWKVYHQIVLPQAYRQSVLEFAHDNPLAGHRGIKLTQEKLLRHFWWLGVMDIVKEYCRTCHVCQKVGKPGQHPAPALLQPVPAIDQAFDHIIVDCVGPMPKTKRGNEYLLTIIDKTTRFPEAIPLRNIKTPTIVKALTNYFTKFGLLMTL